MDPFFSDPSPEALAAAMQRQRQLAFLGQLSGDRVLAPLGQGLEKDAGEMPTSAAQVLAYRQKRNEEGAWNHPAAEGLLRGAVQQFMPNLDLPPETPVQVLRNIAPIAEKFGSSFNALAMKQLGQDKFQRKVDPLTKRIYVEHPLTGESFWEDGTPRSPALRQIPPGLRGPVAPAPTATAPTAGQAVAPVSPVPARPKLRGPGAAGGGGAGLEPWDTRFDKLNAEFKKDMDAASASSRSAFGQSANIIFRGARVLPLLKQVDPKTGQPRQPTTQEWQDINAALLSMQTGGVPAQQMMNEGLPHDIQGDAAKVMSWLTSSPHAPDRQEWIDRFLSNLQREEEQAKQYQSEIKNQRLPSHSMFFSLYPKRAKLAARGYGFDPAVVDQVLAGTYRAPPAEITGSAPKAAPPPVQRAQGKDGKWYVNHGQGWEAE